MEGFSSVFEKFIPNLSDEDTIKIDFAGIPGGYSWRIPGKDRIGVGLGDRIEKIYKKMREQSVYNKFLYVPIFQWISLRHIRKNPELY